MGLETRLARRRNGTCSLAGVAGRSGLLWGRRTGLRLAIVDGVFPVRSAMSKLDIVRAAVATVVRASAGFPNFYTL